jgi:hypothetical protein
MDGKKRTTLISASEKAILMLENKTKSCSKDKLLECCIIDAQSCYNLSNDDYWKNVEMYLKYHHSVIYGK